uniref:Polymerase PB2 n=1 Tax=Sanxia Water Strider Virus 3 TaxID=1608062 RepID=A0A1L3KKG2_9ORTO|nr:polymerase PB2 [Sanxia Water Strider Virus 3]
MNKTGNYLEHLINMVLNSSPEVIDVLRSNSMCNMRVVQRKAKNIKDPNPLSTMMTLMPTKYPLTITSEGAKEAEIPLNLIGPPDAHHHGRRVCKIEAVNWYLENRKPTTGEERDAVDLIYRSFDRDVEEYFRIDWSNSTVSIGEVLFSRENVSMNEEIVNIPNNLRYLYITAALFPEYLFSWELIDREKLAQVKMQRDIVGKCKLSLVSEIRILLNSMDPKYRIIPALHGAGKFINRMRHAVAVQWMSINLSMASPDKNQEFSLARTLGAACWFAVQSRKEDCFTLPNSILSMEFGTRSMKEILEDLDTTDIYVKYLCALVGLPITLAVKLMGFSFHPIGKVERVIKKTLLRRVKYTAFEGFLTFFMQGRGFKAQVFCFGQNVRRMQCVTTDWTTFTNVCGAIALYLRKDIESMKSSKEEKIFQDIATKFKRYPEKLFDCKRDRLIAAVNRRENYSKVEWVKDLSLCQDECTMAYVHDDMIVMMEGGCSWRVTKPMIHPILPPEIKSVHPCLIDFLSPPNLLKELIHFYIEDENFKTLMKKFGESDFKWMNKGVAVHVPNNLKEKVQRSACSHLLCWSEENPGSRALFAFYYCFSHGELNYSYGSNLQEFTWAKQIKVDFTLNSGIFKLVDGVILLDGNPLQKSKSCGTPLTSTLFIPGFRLLEGVPEDADRCFVSQLKNPSKLSLGSKFVVNVGGRDYCFTLDPFHSSRIRDCIEERVNKSRLGAPPFLGKRPYCLTRNYSSNSSLNSSFESGPGPSKRVRIDEDI